MGAKALAWVALATILLAAPAGAEGFPTFRAHDRRLPAGGISPPVVLVGTADGATEHLKSEIKRGAMSPKAQRSRSSASNSGTPFPPRIAPGTTHYARYMRRAASPQRTIHPIPVPSFAST
jgi:hypothetical protein